ncbi:helix-turn-helix domain-containing protein [Oscillospiraceae bacterium LTW-04]|nr:helix-turn-helix transcriptional regulator [Oscillospiraceae bacterium MB24-C1]
MQFIKLLHKVWSTISPDLKCIRICSFSITSIDFIILFNFTSSIAFTLISAPLNRLTIEALDCKDREDAVCISVASIVFSTLDSALSNAVSFKLLALLHCVVPLFNRRLHLQTIVLCCLLYYGKVSFHVKEIMDNKDMTRSKLAKLANIRFEVADKWYNGNIERMDIDVLTRICFVLDCKISDLMTYKK